MIGKGVVSSSRTGGPRATRLGAVENLLAGVRGAAEGAGVLGVELSVAFGLVSKGYGVCSFWVHRWYLVVRSCGRLRTLVWTRASRS